MDIDNIWIFRIVTVMLSFSMWAAVSLPSDMIHCFSALHCLHIFYFVRNGQSVHSIQVSVQQHNALHICIVPYKCGGVNRAHRKQFA